MKRQRQFHIRQGDVLLRAVLEIPKAATQETPKDRVVLAYGEVTGHAHAIDDLDTVDVFVGSGGELYLQVKEGGAMLRHEEHGAIALPAGNYERILQREYSPEEIRNVAD